MVKAKAKATTPNAKAKAKADILWPHGHGQGLTSLSGPCNDVYQLQATLKITELN